MFTVTEKIEFTHEVTVKVPVDGGFKDETFKARFRFVPEDDDNPFRVGESEGLRNFLKAAIVSFSDLIGEDNKPLEYNHDLRDQMLAMPFVALPLYLAYSAAMTGARKGN